MSRNKNKTFDSGFGSELGKFANAVLGSLPSQESVHKPTSTARWFFLQHSAPAAESYPAYIDANQSQWIDAFACFWSTLTARHRAIHLASTIQGQEFIRFLVTIDLSQPIGPDVASFLESESWFAPMTQHSTYMDVCVRYVEQLTTVGDLNAHVVLREQECFIPDGANGVIVTAEAARIAFPVTMEAIGELQVWATNALYRGHESFTNPSILDTRGGEVEALRSLTQQHATSDRIRELTSNVRDRVSVTRGRTLERRARVSRAIFFAQATKRGLDHDRGFSRGA